MSENGITLNLPEFRTALAEYRQWTKRDLPTILNTKGLHVAIGAVKETKRVTQEQITNELKELFQGQNIRTFQTTVFTDPNRMAPLAALLINKQRGRRGERGLYGSEMADAIARFVKYRRSSTGYFASGWIPSIKRLAAVADRTRNAPSQDRDVKQEGIDHGYAIPAVESLFPVVELVNTANSKTDRTNALPRYAGEGFEKAVRLEIESMRLYIIEKMQQRADQYAGRN